VSDRATGNAPRRRRSWYRRRLRRQRIFGVAILAGIIAAVCWQNAARFLPLPTLHASQVLPDSFWRRPNLRQGVASTSPHGSIRPKYIARIPGVYPYSVVPGGVKRPDSLREVAAHDRAVARHYAQFDYNKARLVRVTEPREVYVSYRIRDTIFWTRKKIRLPAGEMLLTDGRITARAKCGNQISETAKPEVSDEEPEEAVLDQPVALEPLGPPLPARPAARLDLPVGPPIVPVLFAGGGFFFPYVNFGGGQLPYCESKQGMADKHCHAHHKKPNTPEPATIILIASGLALILWRYRNTRPLEVKAIDP